MDRGVRFRSLSTPGMLGMRWEVSESHTLDWSSRLLSVLALPLPNRESCHRIKNLQQQSLSVGGRPEFHASLLRCVFSRAILTERFLNVQPRVRFFLIGHLPVFTSLYGIWQLSTNKPLLSTARSQVIGSRWPFNVRILACKFYHMFKCAISMPVTQISPSHCVRLRESTCLATWSSFSTRP